MLREIDCLRRLLIYSQQSCWPEVPGRCDQLIDRFRRRIFSGSKRGARVDTRASVIAAAIGFGFAVALTNVFFSGQYPGSPTSGRFRSRPVVRIPYTARWWKPQFGGRHTRAKASGYLARAGLFSHRQ